MIRFSLISGIFCLCLLLPLRGQSQDSLQGYLAKYADISVRMMEAYGIPASVVLSIAYIESGGGNGRNCRLINNHFGIKGSKRYYIPGTKHLTSYKTYASDTASFRDFCELLSRKKFYIEIKWNMNAGLWARKIGSSGYAASGSAWRKKVMNTINKYNLTILDSGKSPWDLNPFPKPPWK